MDLVFRAKIKNKQEWIISRYITYTHREYEIDGHGVDQDTISGWIRINSFPIDDYTPLFEGDIIEDIETGERYHVKWNPQKAGFEPFVNGYSTESKYKFIGIYYTHPELLEKKI